MDNFEQRKGNYGYSSEPQRSEHRITFHGNNMAFLGLSLYNLLLTTLTLGIYYPWAKCAIRKYLWQETEVAGSRLEWMGTGKEMFKGFIKAYLLLGGILFSFKIAPQIFPPFVAFIYVFVASIVLLLLFPLIIHGAARYRLSRTSYRGIQFGYRGVIGEFYKKTLLDFFLTFITMGIYGFWFQTNLRTYVMKHSRFGSVSGKFTGTGGELFGLSIVQSILTAITFYIYLPWAIIKLMKFDIENTGLVQNEKDYFFKSDATGGGYFIELLKAVFLTVFTLGIAAPVGELMIHRYIVNSLSIDGGFDFDQVQQTEEAYSDATGDDMGDIMDFDF